MAKAPIVRRARGNALAHASKSSPDSTTPPGNRPVHAVRYRGCEAAIWKHNSDKGDTYTITLRKSWRDEDGWHDSPTFLESDLPTLAKTVNDAHSWIAWQRRQQAKGEKGDGA